MFFANRDAIRVNQALSEIIIPVEWRKEEKTMAKSRQTFVDLGFSIDGDDDGLDDDPLLCQGLWVPMFLKINLNPFGVSSVGFWERY